MGRRTDGWTRTDEGVQIPEKVLFHLGQIPSCRFPIERIRTRSLKLGCLSQNCRGGLISQVSGLKSLWTFFLPARQSKQIVPSSNRTVGGHSSISFHSTQSMDFAHPVQYSQSETERAFRSGAYLCTRMTRRAGFWSGSTYASSSYLLLLR